jgi:cytochrome c-type biogenesis protein CcmH/NrfG
MQYCNQAIEFEPENATNYYNLANTLSAQGQITKAIAAYREALRIKPEFPRCQQKLSQALAIETEEKTHNRQQ